MSHDLARQQRDLLMTIIKLTNVVTIASVVLNSYFLLTAFWPTLAQNALALAIVALGLWCRRLASRGQPVLAARLYLSVTMVLLASLALVFSPPFIVNSALALALMVLLASFLDTPGHSLRWGAIGIGLYCLGLTARILGPFEGLQLSAADLAALYLLPSLGLVPKFGPN